MRTFCCFLRVFGTMFFLLGLLGPHVMAQDAVLTASWGGQGTAPLPADRGSTGLWQRLLKLQTTASVLHTTAHPDDEHAGMLTYLSRGQGTRTALLTLNRGESGANAIGAELFDALGLIRTEELLLSDRYYGLDDQYFTAVIDYGFSKTLEEAINNWGREAVLRDMVRVLRMNRPLVVVARFHGSERDGHGHHQAAGGLTPEAYRLAGDSTAFPEQLAEEGLRPWKPLKLYRGGVRPPEPWHVRVESGTFSPWLGTSYQDFGLTGLSLQRSQTSGRTRGSTGPYSYFYERLAGQATVSEGQETGFFDGLDTSLSGLFDLLGETPPDGALDRLQQIERHVAEAVAAYNVRYPEAVVPALARGLETTRNALSLLSDSSDVAFSLRIKEHQFMDAINTALGLRFTALGVPDAEGTVDGPWAPPPTLGVVIPGQAFRVNATLLNPTDIPIQPTALTLEAADGWAIEQTDEGFEPLQSNALLEKTFGVRVPDEPVVSNRYFYRDSIQESRYQVRDSADLHLPSRTPSLVAVATYTVEGMPVEVRETVRTLEANLPYGYESRELKVAPALVVNVEPDLLIAPLGQEATVTVRVDVLNHADEDVDGTLGLETPEGWTVEPDAQALTFNQAGQRRQYAFTVSVPNLSDQTYEIHAVARANGREYRQGYEAIRHRDLETNYLYEPSVTRIRGIEAALAPDLTVGYVMGVGDEVPDGIEQLGATVHLLDTDDLATGALDAYDVIVIGTRAYAVRQDLLTYNQRLLDYAHDGGHLLVLYQTPEFNPTRMAPYPAQLPRSAEEVSEEDAPVTVLAPDHPVFHTPNTITPADFDGWVEQRGSKFFSEWDAAYTPLLESHDQGQEPQRGGWLIATYGDGLYTYFAYAIHRQTPYGVPGPYRLFANLLSLGQ